MKRFVCLLIVLVLSIMLVACGSDDSKKDSKEKEVTTSSASDKKEKEKKADKEEEKDSKKSDDSKGSNSSNESDTTQKADDAASEAAETSSSANTIILYNSDGEEVKLIENSDGTYSTEDGVIYYMGEDKIFRAKGHPDLYMIVAEEDGDDSYESPLSRTTIKVYYEDGTEEYVTINKDETWTASNGVIYYMGEDNILRAKGYPDLYTVNPNGEDDELENQALGNSMTVYYEDGTEETVTNNVDEGTWETSAGAVYYLGDDGVLRAKGYPDLYVDNPTAN